jgi:thymidine phosphorylase
MNPSGSDPVPRHISRPGRLFLVIGADGAGRTTLFAGAAEALAHEPGWLFVSPLTAHSHDLAALLMEGRDVVGEVTPRDMQDLIAGFPDCCVIQIETTPARRRARTTDRPSTADRAPPSPPLGIDTVAVTNDTDIATGISRFVAALRTERQPRLAIRQLPITTWHDNIAYLNAGCRAVPAAGFLGPNFAEIRGRGRSIRARVHVCNTDELVAPDEIGLSAHAFRILGLPAGTPVTIAHTGEPDSLPALRAKIRGEALDETQYGDVLRDIAEGRYPDREVAAFLVTTCGSLTDTEVEALARVRATLAGRMRWAEPIVADKHSLGGVSGSRITLIVIPIVAAHGMAIPKTSSRAITSPSGTADAMEVLANVDLSPGDLRRVVTEARGCIAWNGHLNHSPVDDVMNAITRPLGIDSVRWAVASILSKKLAAGATHVAIDIPYGPQAKTRTKAEAAGLADLFTRIGQNLGLVIEAWPTDASAPIGRGIGPALEVRDVLQILDGDPHGPEDLREKALFFAGRILGWDADIGPQGGPARARELLASGAARVALERIVRAQGARLPPAGIAALTRDCAAPRSGVVTGIDGARIGAVARRAGAPGDKGAGVDLLVPIGAHIRAGDPLYHVHASTEGDLEVALAEASGDAGYRYAD